MNSAIRQINHHSVDNQNQLLYSSFEQLGTGLGEEGKSWLGGEALGLETSPVS